MDGDLGDQSPRVGRLLVANPLLPDPNFDRTVVLLIATHDEGALGLVLNRPSPMGVAEPLPQWVDLAAEPAVLFFGGPVQRQAVIALARHDGAGNTPAEPPADDRPEPEGRSVKPIAPGLATVDLEQDPSEVVGKVGRLRLFAGYSGWSAGQLEGEMEAGAWWVVEADPEDAFTVEPDQLWRDVLRRQPPPLCYAAYFPGDPQRQ